mmetsp:Transcript_32439/g.46110  ORF Transcript_32439/g.46110 Transcript_32439/m.46110 type:complete len:200 (+) Transcript_32439:847-1446(+)
MLCRDNNSVDLDWSNRSICVLLVLDGDLGLSIRTQPPQTSVLTDIRQTLSQLGCHHVGQWHAVLSFITGITKHDTLITSTNIQLTLSNVNSSSNIWRLLVDTNQNLAGIAAQTLTVDTAEVINEGVETDLTNLFTDDGFVIDLSRGGDLSENHDHVVLGCGLASNLGVRISFQAGIEDSIGHLISKLIRVSFVHRLTGE